MPSRTIAILPDAGIRSSRIFDPIQPARRAVDASGLRLSTMSGTKKCLGTTHTSVTLRRAKIIIQQHEIWIGGGCKALDFRCVSAIRDLAPERFLLTLELELIVAIAAEEVCNWKIGGELVQSRLAAVRAIGPSRHPLFRPCARVLRATQIGSLRFFELEFHRTIVRLAGYRLLSMATALPQLADAETWTPAEPVDVIFADRCSFSPPISAQPSRLLSTHLPHGL